MYGIVRQVGNHGARRAVGARCNHHAQADQHQLRGTRWQCKSQRQQQAATQAIGNSQADFTVRALTTEAVAEHGAENHADATAQHDDGGDNASLIGAHVVVTVQVAGHPHNHRTADKQLQAAGNIGGDDRTAAVQGVQRASNLARGLSGALGRDFRFFDNQRVEQCQQQAEQGHTGKRPTPAKMLGHHTT
ncbi:hypothetical protein D3C72_1316970 [compost metagenome]